MRNMVLTRRFVFTLIMVVTLVGVVACDLKPEKAEKISFLNNAYSVMMPSSWSLRTDLNDVADLQMGNLIKEAYAIVISENKMDFDGISLEGHSDLTRSMIREGLTNFQETGPEYVTHGKFPVLRYRLTGTIDGINLVYWHVTVETDEHYHQILLWSLKSKFADNEADYNALIQSFEAL